MVLADVINATAYDEEEFEYGVAATLACILAGAVFTFLFLAGGPERQERTQTARDAEDDDARTALLRACTRVLSWEADSDDEQESKAFATALDDALKTGAVGHDGLSTMPTPPSVNTWAQQELQLLAESDLEGSSAGLELGATALALATTRRDHWEACETIGDEGRAAAFVVAASENVHASVLLLGTRCRPRAVRRGTGITRRRRWRPGGRDGNAAQARELPRVPAISYSGPPRGRGAGPVRAAARAGVLRDALPDVS